MSASPRNDAKLCNISDFVHCYAWQKRSEGLFIATVGTGCIENGVILCVCGASVLLHAIPKRSTAVAAIIESIVGCNSFFVITRVPVRIPSSQTPERKKKKRAGEFYFSWGGGDGPCSGSDVCVSKQIKALESSSRYSLIRDI